MLSFHQGFFALVHYGKPVPAIHLTSAVAHIFKAYGLMPLFRRVARDFGILYWRFTVPQDTQALHEMIVYQGDWKASRRRILIL